VAGGDLVEDAPFRFHPLVGVAGEHGARNVPVPDWVKAAIDEWAAAAAISAGKEFRCVCRSGKHWGEGVTERVVWHVVKEYAQKAGIAQLAPHDLRRSCAKLCHAAGGELEQIQFLLGSAIRPDDLLSNFE
jgi:site-specific recombinase XerD